MKRKDLMKQFSDSGVLEFVLDEVVAVTKGEKKDYSCMHNNTRERMLNLLFSALADYIKITNLEVNNTADILQLLKDGVISIDEVKTLMEALRTRMEADILPSLEEKVDALTSK